MNNNIFKFKKFSILQHPKVFKIGTDSVLLGCLANVSQATKILDIGTGTGLLALMAAQRNSQAQITAIDSEKEAFTIAKHNVENSPFAYNISVIHSELKNFTSPYKFNYLLCNPPFFKTSEQLHQKHPVARHQLKLNFPELLKKTKELLADNGCAGYIFPYTEEKNLLSIAQNVNLYPKRIIHISGIYNGKIRRTFLELSHTRQKIQEDNIYIEQSPRVWSETYKELTKDFYL